MIRLIDVTKYYVTNFGRHYVFRNVSLDLPLDRNIGIIGPNGAGKSTFLRLLSGADQPSSGTIIKSGSISPPMGLTPGLQGSLSALENVRFAGRIYGMNRQQIDEMVIFVRDLAKIGKYFDMPIETYSAGMRQRIAFGINMSMQFDYYLFDEISAGGDREFRRAAKAMVAERLRTAKFVMTSHDIDELLELCHAGIVIKNGELTYFDDIQDAAKFYEETPRNDQQQEPKRPSTVAGDEFHPEHDGHVQAQPLSKRVARRRRAKWDVAVAADGQERQRRKRARLKDIPLTAETAVLPRSTGRSARRSRRAVVRLARSDDAAYESYNPAVGLASMPKETNMLPIPPSDIQAEGRQHARSSDSRPVRAVREQKQRAMALSFTHSDNAMPSDVPPAEESMAAVHAGGDLKQENSVAGGPRDHEFGATAFHPKSGVLPFQTRELSKGNGLPSVPFGAPQMARTKSIGGGNKLMDQAQGQSGRMKDAPAMNEKLGDQSILAGPPDAMVVVPKPRGT